MHKSSLLEIIRTFTPKELIKFEDFVNSPYFNKNKNVTNLFVEIKKYAPEFTDENLEKEKVWNNLFSGKKYNYGIMKNLIHDLNKLFETFILFEQYSANTFQKEYDLIETLDSRKIYKLTLSKMDQFEKRVKTEFEQKKYTDICDYLLISSHYNNAKESFIHQKNLKLDKSDSINAASEYLLYYFLVQSFKLINNTVSHELQGNPTIEDNLLMKFFNKLQEHKIIEELFLNVQNNQNKLTKIISCFFYMYKAISSDDKIEDYEKFKFSLIENIDHLSGFELQNLNNCRVVILTKLKIPYLNKDRENLDWYKLLMENNALTERNGLITYFTMLNLVNNSVSLKEFEFAENFIAKYQKLLPEDSRENTYNYCMAAINFGKKEFGKSLELLSLIRNEKLMLKYNSKILYLKIYFELNDYESYIYAFDSFLHFKKRNKHPNEKRARSFNNFGNYLKRLFKLKNVYDNFEYEKLRKDIANNGGIHSNWILEKLDELEKVKGKK